MRARGATPDASTWHKKWNIVDPRTGYVLNKDIPQEHVVQQELAKKAWAERQWIYQQECRRQVCDEEYELRRAKMVGPHASSTSTSTGMHSSKRPLLRNLPLHFGEEPRSRKQSVACTESSAGDPNEISGLGVATCNEQYQRHCANEISTVEIHAGRDAGSNLLESESAQKIHTIDWTAPTPLEGGAEFSCRLQGRFQ